MLHLDCKNNVGSVTCLPIAALFCLVAGYMFRLGGSEESEMSKIEQELIDPVTEPGTEKAHRAARAAISSVPVLGGAILEAFNAIIVPPMERRKAAWMQQVTEAINELYEKGIVTEEDLGTNEKFFTTLVHASNVALKNHQKEKLDALKNATLNSALPTSPDDSVQQLFLNIVDTCTVWHIKLLELFSAPEEWAKEHGHRFPNWSMSSSITAVIESAYSELAGQRAFYELIWKDLYRQGLISTDGVAGMMTTSGALAKRTTDFGDNFLAFISRPKALDA
jgi:hypothetical protein